MAKNLYLYDEFIFTSAQAHKRTSALSILLAAFLISAKLVAQSPAPIVVGQVYQAHSPTLEGLNNVDMTIMSPFFFCASKTQKLTSFNPAPPPTANINGFLDIDGAFYCAFPQVPTKSPPVATSISIVPSRNYDWSNGATVADMDIMSKHILGLTPFNAYWQYINADLSLNGTVSTLDIVLLRHAILGNSYPISESWEFVDQSRLLFFSVVTGDYELTPLGVQFLQEPLSIVDYPWSILSDSKHPKNIDIYGNTVNIRPFIAFKMGHVGGSIPIPRVRKNQNTSTVVDGAEVRNSRINIEQNYPIKKGAVVTVEVKVQPDGNIPLSGLQFGLKFDKEYMKFIGTQTEELTNYNSENLGLNNIEDGEMRFLWFSGDSKIDNISNESKLFSFTFEALADIDNLSEYINQNDDVLPTQYINKQGVCDANLKLSIKNTLKLSDYKVFPTLVSNYVVLQSNNETNEDANFQVYSADGKLALSKAIHLNTGTNTIVIDGLESLIQGSYCCLLTNSKGKILHKSLIVT